MRLQSGLMPALVCLSLVVPTSSRAQHDGPPASGTRPAPGWLPGEYIADTHSLAISAELPPGEYTLLAGLVDAAGGTAIPAAGSADGRAWVGVIAVPP